MSIVRNIMDCLAQNVYPKKIPTVPQTGALSGHSDDFDSELHGLYVEKETYLQFEIHVPENIREKHGVSCFSGAMMTLTAPENFPSLDLKRIEDDENFLTEYWIMQGCMERGSKYHLKFKDNFAKMAHCTVPQQSEWLPEEVVRLFAIYLAWGFTYDDVVDNSFDFRTSSIPGGMKTLEAALDVFKAILNDEYGHSETEDVEFPNLELPLFHPLCQVWRDFHAMCHAHIPFYEARKDDLLQGIFESFDAFVMAHGHKVDGRFSEESGRFWLRLVTCYKGAIEISALIRGIVVPRRVRKDPYFMRLYEASQDAFCCINDIFGVTKDLLYEETDTLVMFKYLEKRINLQDAFKQTLDFLNSQLRDVKLLSSILRDRYTGNAAVEGWLKANEDFLDGYIRFCSSAKRYGGQTTIRSEQHETAC